MGAVSRQWREALVIVLVATLAQLSYFWSSPAIVRLDSPRYLHLATNLPVLLQRSHWDLFTGLGYPLFLWLFVSWTRSPELIVLAQHGLAVASCVLVWLAAKKLVGGWGAFIGALLVAL